MGMRGYRSVLGEHIWHTTRHMGTKWALTAQEVSCINIQVPVISCADAV